MNENNFGLEPQGPDLKRLMLAVVLMTGILMTYNTFFAPQPVAQNEVAQKDAPKVIEVEKVKKAEKPAKLASSVKNATPNNLPVKEIIFKQDVNKNLGDESFVAVRGGYEATVSSQGGQLKKVVLTGYDKPITLGGKDINGAYLSGIESLSPNFNLKTSDAYKIASQSKDAIRFERITPEGILVARTYTFKSNNFLVDSQIELTNKTNNAKEVALGVRMVSTTEVDDGTSMLTPGVSGFSAVCKNSQTRETFTLSDLEEGSQSIAGKIKYSAFDERYFLMTMGVDEAFKATDCIISEAENNSNEDQKLVLAKLEQAPSILSAGQTKTYQFSSYVGPKEMHLLEKAGGGLDENISYGWFGVISRPLLKLMTIFFNFAGNFGLAIILLTMFIKLVTFPLTQKSFVSMQKMKEIAPELKKIQKKYAHDKTQLGQKQMEFYKEKGINPMAGCLPMLIQMPVWFALYQMLWNSIELFQQPFYFWVHDLTAADPYYILPVVMGASMFVQTAFQPTPADQPQMKYVMWFMPIMLTFVMLNMPAGLSLYILVNNILTIAQQYFIKKKHGVASAEV